MAILPRKYFRDRRNLNLMREAASKPYKVIGKNIKHFRKQRDMSQQDLANLCNTVDRSKISDMENAKEDFMLSTLIEVAFALELPLEVLVAENANVDY
ncbi:helix-turn-helix domain-containing protein [Pedobacter sp. SYP-B3415]|uniref:helix-turn-helix domain-containing protein n=1 Tax=Pedobacter sp. SYP-B3415 TaxID=2496641 RepID=UPI00197EBF21|nr:helix-turn-helix transcriptional regulator [Pedobacter sp. SYP-B3415]